MERFGEAWKDTRTHTHTRLLFSSACSLRLAQAPFQPSLVTPRDFYRFLFKQARHILFDDSVSYGVLQTTERETHTDTQTHTDTHTHTHTHRHTDTDTQTHTQTQTVSQTVSQSVRQRGEVGLHTPLHTHTHLHTLASLLILFFLTLCDSDSGKGGQERAGCGVPFKVQAPPWRCELLNGGGGGQHKRRA